MPKKAELVKAIKAWCCARVIATSAADSCQSLSASLSLSRCFDFQGKWLRNVLWLYEYTDEVNNDLLGMSQF